MKIRFSLLILSVLMTGIILYILFLPVYIDPYGYTMRLIEAQSLSSFILALVSIGITTLYAIHYKKNYLKQEIKVVHPKYSIGLAILPLLVLIQVVTFSNITKI